MLQQTVVSIVVPYFERWMRRWPDVHSLAGATERQVLAVWQGMGYYARARRLLRAARRIVEGHGGRVPSGRAELTALPGVGPYIADAVRSLAFGADVVAVDTNVCRVMMRLLDLRGRATERRVRRRVRRWAEAGLPPGDSPRYNQALMDLGSLLCRPRRPRCGECLLREGCLAFRRGTQYEIPRPTGRRVRKIRTAVAVFRKGGDLYLQKRPADGLFASMWEFPGGKVRGSETPPEALARECREELGVEVRPGRRLLELTHYYTVFRVRLHAFLCEPPPGLPLDEGHRWVALEGISEYPMPSANGRIVEALREQG
jgi:A/G-specific adenine glycosylase